MRYKYSKGTQTIHAIANNKPNDESGQQGNYGDLVETFSTIVGTLMGYASTEWINVDISTAQIKVIFVLHYGGILSVNQLAGHLNISQPTASHLIEKLVQAGYVTRIESTEDRRRIDLHLTDAGHAVADRLSGVAYKGIIAQWMSQLGNDQRATLAANLHALLSVIEHSPDWRADRSPDLSPQLSTKGN